MDPVSAIGLASAIVGIIDVAARSIGALRALQQRWKAADLTISLLISQLTTLKAALSQIKEWISTSLNADHHYQLIMDLGASLDSCETLLLFLDGQLAHLDWNDNNDLSFESKLKAVLQDKTVKECATHLANQSMALNLLLTALNCRCISEQSALLQAKENRVLLDQARDDSSSLLCLRDSASFGTSLTAATQRSSLLRISFDFDRQLTATSVYHRQWESLIKETLRRGRKARESSTKLQNLQSNKPMSIVNSRVENIGPVIDIRILATGHQGSPVDKLREVMSILCEGYYDPEMRRGHIYQVLLTTIKATLDKMMESSQPLESLDTITRHHASLCQQISTSSAEVSEELWKTILSLWKNPGVRDCYQHSVEGTVHPSATYFLDSIARIGSPGYVPSFEDAAMSLIARNWRLTSLTLPVVMGSQRYNFVRWTPRGVLTKPPSEASSRNMADECKDLDAILFMADLATYDAYSADGSLGDELNNTLLRFRHVRKLPWLAKKDIILVFLNVEKLFCMPPNVHALGSAHNNNRTRGANLIVQSFVSFNEDEYREVHVIFAENEVRAKNLEVLDRVVKQILNKKASAA